MSAAVGAARTAALVVGFVTWSAHAVAQVECRRDLARAESDPVGEATGSFCAEGETGGGELQFAWTVPAEAGHTRWTLSLSGQLGAGLVAQIASAERDGSGNVSASDEVAEIDAGQVGAGADRQGLLLRPGLYEVRLGASTPGLFRIEATASDAGAAAAETLTKDAAVGGTLQGEPVEIGFTIAGMDAKRRWDIEVAVPPEARGEIDLVDAAGAVMAHRDGSRGLLALHDLGLAGGDYRLRIGTRDATETSFVAELKSSGPRVPARAEEPDDAIARAGALALGKPIQGRLAEPGDVDTFVFEAPADGRLVEAALDGAAADQELCLVDGEGRDVQCRSGPEARLQQLRLNGRRYLLVRGAARPDAPYRLAVRATKAADGDVDIEPNDTAATANPIEADQVRSGRFGGEDVDVYALTAEGAPELRAIMAEGAGVAELAVLDRSQQVVARSMEATAGVIALDEVYLAPGPYTIRVAGKGGAYTLQAKRAGPPDARLEREPNGDANPNRIRVGGERIGRLADADDRDVYRFSLAAPTHVALTLTPPAGGAVDMEIEWGWPALRRPTARMAEQPVTYDALLDPGDYIVRLRPYRTSPEPYTLALAYADPFALPDDLEPNDSPSQAKPFPATLTMTGEVGNFSDEDWFVLPAPQAAGGATVRVGSNAELSVLDGQTEVPITWTDEPRTARFDVPAGRPLKIGLHGEGAYALSAAIDGIVSAPAAEAALPVSLRLDLPQQRVAAYWQRAQRLEGKLSVANDGKEPLDLALDARSSHDAFRPSLAAATLRVEPGSEAAVPIEILVDPDARSGIDAQVVMRARDAKGAQATVATVLTPDPNVEPVDERELFALPEPLRGGFDLAAPDFGGRGPPEQSDDEARTQQGLFDGLVGEGFTADAADTPIEITRVFGGVKPWPIAGIVLHSQVADRLAPAEQLRGFDLLLSADGVDFEPVLSGELSMLAKEQAFVLDPPRLAKAARLRLRDNHADNLGKIGLNEWQVISTPAPEELVGVSLDVADPGRGGNVVWAEPSPANDWADAKRLLGQGQGEPLSAKVPAGVAPALAVGFRDGRAVEITGIVWTQAAQVDDRTRPWGPLRVAASMDGPLGPWREIGRVEPKAGTAVRLDVPAGTWARYLRFRAIDAAGEEQRWVWPQALNVLERPIDAEHPSAIGAWGMYGRAASYEATHPPPARPPPVQSGTTLAAPAPFDMAAGASGIVAHRTAEDWYALKRSDAPGTLRLTLAGEPTIDADLELTDPGGTVLPLRQVESAGSRLVFESDAAPGTDLRLHVFEPARSVAVAYDTSVSLSGFTSEIRQATAAFAEGLVPDDEFMNVMNFEAPFLLPEWSDRSWVVQGALAASPPETDSSNLEATLLNVMDGLHERKGARSVIVVTDAESPGYALQQPLWEALAQSRPQVFVGHIGLGRDLRSQTELLQGLTAASGGAYARAMAQADLDVVAERAAAWLRRPVRYTLTAEIVPPGTIPPGALAVAAAPVVSATTAQPPAAGAIAIVLDASGSMLQRLDGKRRIAIARDVLNTVLDEVVAEGTPVSLRVFGDTAKDVCGTRSALPLGPLDPAAVAKVLDKVKPRNGAKTPIAAALKAVGHDLATAGAGARTVVLITDGEETCGGDPQAAIETLAAGGVEVRVNIVGFAVAEPAIRRQFEAWAKAGRGRYFDAAKSADLEAALGEAVRTEFQAYDPAGALVAQGTVGGDPVELRPGRYRVTIGARTLSEDVVVSSGDTTRLVASE